MCLWHEVQCIIFTSKSTQWFKVQLHAYKNVCSWLDVYTYAHLYTNTHLMSNIASHCITHVKFPHKVDHIMYIYIYIYIYTGVHTYAHSIFTGTFIAIVKQRKKGLDWARRLEWLGMRAWKLRSGERNNSRKDTGETQWVTASCSTLECVSESKRTHMPCCFQVCFHPRMWEYIMYVCICMHKTHIHSDCFRYLFRFSSVIYGLMWCCICTCIRICVWSLQRALLHLYIHIYDYICTCCIPSCRSLHSLCIYVCMYILCMLVHARIQHVAKAAMYHIQAAM